MLIFVGGVASKETESQLYEMVWRAASAWHRHPNAKKTVVKCGSKASLNSKVINQPGGKQQ